METNFWILIRIDAAEKLKTFQPNKVEMPRRKFVAASIKVRRGNWWRLLDACVQLMAREIGFLPNGRVAPVAYLTPSSHLVNKLSMRPVGHLHTQKGRVHRLTSVPGTFGFSWAEQLLLRYVGSVREEGLVAAFLFPTSGL